MPDQQAVVVLRSAHPHRLGAMGIAVAMVVSGSGVAAADSADDDLPPPEPIIVSDDVRTHAMVARHLLEASVTLQHARGDTESVDMYTFQVGLGPTQLNQESWLRDLIGRSDHYAVRARLAVIDPSGGDAVGGPFTFAVQRHEAIEPLLLPGMFSLHGGLEFAISTPWLAGRMETPPEILRRTNAVDTELQDNGWSLRPAAGFGRLDFLACRSLHAEVGVSPEAFVPATGGRPTEYGLRGHAQLGFSLACQNEPTSFLNHFAVYGEYRARGRLYASGEPAQYHDLVALGLQGEYGWALGGVFVSADPGQSIGDSIAIGLRLQLGIGANK